MSKTVPPVKLPFEVMTEYSPSAADSVIAREARIRFRQGSFFYPCGKRLADDPVPAT
ncbi:hypothetical protein [Mycobacterium sp. 1164985.4]|uniref:hypothetical protein n=1 Tax=Mycobacterium sp. 1164985.4 TaxID=1834069 RepID=UPI0018D32B31|nr:hypothetical protein [Mycobacterium sp. 1164985.4]